MESFYYENNMRIDVIQWYKHCPKCQTCKISRHNRQTLSNFPNMPGRLEIIHMNLVELLAALRENKYILTMRDRGSGFLITTPIASKDSAIALESIEKHFLATFGVPREIVMDNGKEFCSEIFEAFTERLAITHKHTTAYHPQYNYFTERTHRILKSSLRSLND